LLTDATCKQRLYQFFKGIEQDSETKEQLDFTESAATLVQPAIIKHKKEEIRIYAALCISEIFRLFAPNCPYDNESLQVMIDRIAYSLYRSFLRLSFWSYRPYFACLSARFAG